MILRSTRAVAAVVAAIVGLALLFGAAMPGVAAANESPSPPALGVLVGCPSRHTSGEVIGTCSVAARSSSSAILPASGRLLPAWVSSPALGLRAERTGGRTTDASPESPRGPLLASNSARAPPVSTS